MVAVIMQNCTNRDEDNNSNHHQVDQIEQTSLMRSDSTKTPGTDPPVRDGDNWRIKPNN